MTTWQDIGTAKLGHRIDALCVDVGDGSEVVFLNVVLADDEEPYAFIHDGGTYWPHQNGFYLTHWRPTTSPPSKEGE
ncbi:MAG: hypothetical protein J0I08_22960 [Rhizobiales bacterium]|nr:hypothetical protein [Hyphomicrobiales bacterium]